MSSASFNPLEFDPLNSPSRSTTQQTQQIPNTPFSSAFLPSFTAPPVSTTSSSDLLIDFSLPTPRAPPPPRALLNLPSRALPPPVLKNPSPLKMAHNFFDESFASAGDGEPSFVMPGSGESSLADSFGASGGGVGAGLAFARDSPEGTVRKLVVVVGTKGVNGWEEREERGTPVKANATASGAGGKKWAVVSPHKDGGDTSVVLSHDEHSLLMNEGGSFLLNNSIDLDTTLALGSSASPSALFGGVGADSFANLSGIDEGDEDEEGGNGSLDMRNLLNNLGRSVYIGDAPPHSVAALSTSILPLSLTSSTRLALSSSSSALSAVAQTSPDVLEVDTTVNFNPPTADYEPELEEPRSLLACSTASYRSHRDSPARPRIVSVQAEVCSSSPSMSKKTGGGGGGRVSDVSEAGSERTEGSSVDVGEMLKGWREEEMSTTEIHDQLPPTGVFPSLPGSTNPSEPTMTFELGLLTPLKPTLAHPITAPSPFVSLPSPTLPAPSPPPHQQQQLIDLLDLSISEEPSSSLPTPPPPAPLPQTPGRRTSILHGTRTPLTTRKTYESAQERLKSRMEVLRAASASAVKVKAEVREGGEGDESVVFGKRVDEEVSDGLLGVTPKKERPSSLVLMGREAEEGKLIDVETPKRTDVVASRLTAATTRTGDENVAPVAVGIASPARKMGLSEVGTVAPKSERKETTRERLEKLKEERERKMKGGVAAVGGVRSTTAPTVGGIRRPMAGTTTTTGLKRPTTSSSSTSAGSTRPSTSTRPTSRPPSSTTNASTSAPVAGPRLTLAETLAAARAARTAKLASSTSSTIGTAATGAGAKPRLAFNPSVRPPAIAKSSSGSGTGLRRPTTTTTAAAPGVKRAVGTTGASSSRIGVLGARANGAK